MTQAATVDRPQLAENAKHRPGTFTTDTAKAAVARREQLRQERLGSAREALEAELLEIAQTLARGALGSQKLSQTQYAAGRFIVEMVLGQPTARTEHVNLDRWDTEWREFLEQQSP